MDTAVDAAGDSGVSANAVEVFVGTGVVMVLDASLSPAFARRR